MILLKALSGRNIFYVYFIYINYLYLGPMKYGHWYGLWCGAYRWQAITWTFVNKDVRFKCNSCTSYTINENMYAQNSWTCYRDFPIDAIWRLDNVDHNVVYIDFGIFFNKYFWILESLIMIIIASGNGLSPSWRQSITWSNAELMSTSTALGSNLSDLKMLLKMSSDTKGHVFPGLNVLNNISSIWYWSS